MRLKSTHVLPCLAAFTCLWTFPLQEASAFECSRVSAGQGDESGPSISWMERVVDFSLFITGTQDIPSDLEFDALRASFEPWEQAFKSPDGTTDLRFNERPLSHLDAVGYNFLDPSLNENLLIFRDDEWPHPAQVGLVIALTTTTQNALTGEILDADIEFNSANVQFTVGDTNTDTDLMNTTVHEIGHMLGLNHSSDTAATMFAASGPQETKKRDLAADDISAMLFKYPAAEENGYCDTVVNADCGFCAQPGALTATTTVTVCRHSCGGTWTRRMRCLWPSPRLRRPARRILLVGIQMQTSRYSHSKQFLVVFSREIPLLVRGAINSTFRKIIPSFWLGDPLLVFA